LEFVLMKFVLSAFYSKAVGCSSAIAGREPRRPGVV
jgi:hypothetical protein